MILYMTEKDAPILLEWLNSEENIAWIVKTKQQATKYHWRAIQSLEKLAPYDYCLWRADAYRLTIPSGSLDVEDAVVVDPFSGWSQTLPNNENARTPWFGALHPGPYRLNARFEGAEAKGAIARSDFSWTGNHFRLIGHGADPTSYKWWQRLRRFLGKSAIPIPWPPDAKRNGAYAFPDAYVARGDGVHLDINPTRLKL